MTLATELSLHLESIIEWSPSRVTYVINVPAPDPVVALLGISSKEIILDFGKVHKIVIEL